MTGLLICPTCSTDTKRIVLGSVDAEGYMHIERYRGSGGTTIIYVKESTILHSCGFGTSLSTTDTTFVWENTQN